MVEFLPTALSLDSPMSAIYTGGNGVSTVTLQGETGNFSWLHDDIQLPVISKTRFYNKSFSLKYDRIESVG